MKKPSQPFVVKLAILTVLTSLIWTGFDVYRRLTKKPAPEVPAEILSPITPELNQETLARLEKTIYLEEGELSDTVILSPENTSAEPVITEEVPVEEPEATSEPVNIPADE